MIDEQRFAQLAEEWERHCYVVGLYAPASEITASPTGKKILDEFAAFGEEVIPALAERYKCEQAIIDLDIINEIRRYISEVIKKNYLTWEDAT